MAMGPYLSIITFNVNGLNAPTKRKSLAEWIQKQDPYICCLQETHLKTRDTYRLKVKGQKKIFLTNGDQKKAGVTILISDKIDFQIKTVRHYGEQCGDTLENWKQNCHMTQQSHSWAYTPRKPDLKETRAPQCSSQHCL